MQFSCDSIRDIDSLEQVQVGTLPFQHLQIHVERAKLMGIHFIWNMKFTSTSSDSLGYKYSLTLL